jgi:hypothetical protein
MPRKQVRHQKDIVVVGAGPAGIATAIAAARQGAAVSLLEKTDRLGGTVTNCLIHTLGGLYDSSGKYLNEGMSVELAEKLIRADAKTEKRKIGRVWALSVCPDIFKQVAADWLKEEKNIRIFYESKDLHCKVGNNCIQTLSFTSGNQKVMTLPCSVIDTTGNAELINIVDTSLVVDNAGQAMAGLIYQIRNVDPDILAFPRNVTISQKLRKAAEDLQLPDEFSNAGLDRGVFADEAYVKLSFALRNSSFSRKDLFRKTSEIKIIGDQLIAFLKQFPAFSQAEITQSGTLGIRDGGRFHGEYMLSGSDVRSLKKFTDCACRCAWPIEYWDPKKGIELEYLRTGDFYEIPLRSLKVRNIKNLWAAGKCLSADRIAQASARVVGSCWAMGEAAGNAASGEKNEQ